MTLSYSSAEISVIATNASVSQRIGAARVPACAGADILLTRFKFIGDVVFTLPAVHSIRGNFQGPQKLIDLAAETRLPPDFREESNFHP